MTLWLGLLIGLKEIWAHKFRSFLTVLGVILGAASLLSMFSLTAGIAKGMRDSLQQVGGIEKVNVIPQDPPIEQEGYAEISPGRTLGDAEAIARCCPLVSHVAPTSEIASAAISRANHVFRSPVVGTWPDFVPVNKHELESGRSLTELDLENAHRVCVIGQGVARKLWPERAGFNPLGESILINGRPFTVVGQFRFYEREEDKRRRELGAKKPKPARPTKAGAGAPRGSNPFERKNNTVLIPITTMFYEFKSANVVNKEDQGPNHKLDQLSIRIADTTRFGETLAQVQEVVLANHRGIEDFTFDTKQEWFDAIEQNIRNTRMSGGIIAGISLLVGGIGITNIMLASITERIREIGVRRAVGAKSRDIFLQIVVESAVIGFIGGLLGLIASLGVMRLLVLVSPAENAPVIEWSSVLISFSFAVGIGVASGFYPALKASRLDPISALRFG